MEHGPHLDGTFDAAPAFPRIYDDHESGTYRAAAVATGDIDGDGAPDLMVANHEPLLAGGVTNNISFLLDNGGQCDGNGIPYRGRDVMLGTVNVYYVWLGDWSGVASFATVQSIAENFVNDVDGTDYYNILTTYYSSSNGQTIHHVSNAIHFDNSYTMDQNSAQFAIAVSMNNLEVETNGALGSFFSSAFANTALPYDSNGLYVILTPPNLTISDTYFNGMGFTTVTSCTNFCGIHNTVQATNGGSNVQVVYAVAPYLNACGGCHVSVSPNNNNTADTLVYLAGHEIIESVADPAPDSGWYDTSSMDTEVVDKCAGEFNVTFGMHTYRLPKVLVNALGGSCALAYP